MCEVKVLDARHCPHGITMRATRPGPEKAMVDAFIDYYVEMAKSRRWKRNVLLLVEPRLNGAFPDLVVVHYDKAIADRRCQQPLSMATEDIKIMSFIAKREGCTLEHIGNSLGMNSLKVLSCLERLLAYNLVVRLGGKWRAAPRKRYLAVKEIVAVEAKISNPRQALDQAFKNTSFSNASYALLGAESIRRDEMERYRELGVGAISGKKKAIIVEPELRRLPICPTSLQINEWACREAAKAF